MPWNGTSSVDSLPLPSPIPVLSGGLLHALDALRMRIPRHRRSARARRSNPFAGAWVQVSPSQG